MKQHIIISGGGDLKAKNNRYPFADYLLAQSECKTPKICFLATATGDAEKNIVRFYEIFAPLSCSPSHLSLFNPPDKLEQFILNQDIIYVGGGNTRNLIALWKAWDLDIILKKALEKGIILSGWSAGSICWFEQGLSDYIPGELNPIKGLGFLSGSHCPHYDTEPERKPKYQELIAQGILKPGFAVDDNVALHFIDGSIHTIVRSNERGKAYFVSMLSGIIEENPL